jgi:hypothetical protein
MLIVPSPASATTEVRPSEVTATPSGTAATGGVVVTAAGVGAASRRETVFQFWLPRRMALRLPPMRPAAVANSAVLSRSAAVATLMVMPFLDRIAWHRPEAPVASDAPRRHRVPAR